jgi:hypothetical protein
MIPPERLAEITHAKIHPAIGIARIGTSENKYFIAPEVPNPSLEINGDQYRDSSGAFSRQAVRFRVYGYKKVGDQEVPIGEITSQEAVITWTVRVANAKAAWYEGSGQQYHPLDLTPEIVLPARNPGIPRRDLIIDSGAVELCTSGTGNRRADLGGQICHTPVQLGTISLCQNGRLIFLGGRGQAGLKDDGDPVDFDDISDGSVDATVQVGHRTICCVGAWVVTCPPSFAPGFKTVRTLYDLLRDKAQDWGWLPERQGKRVSFPDEILPIFERLSRLQWTSRVFEGTFGAGREYDLLALENLARLREVPPSAGPDLNLRFRQEIFEKFRKPDAIPNFSDKWPPLWGDAEDDTAFGAAAARRQFWNCSISVLQWNAIRLWAQGEFDDSGIKASIFAKNELGLLKTEDQPAALDCASLSFALADAFHPGFDVPWVIRTQSIYCDRQPFRIRRGSVQLSAIATAPTLSFEQAKNAGVLDGLVPGSLTCWMSVPWQVDLQGCSKGRNLYGVPPIPDPAWWPARVPDWVLFEEQDRLKRSSWYTLPTAEWAVAADHLNNLALVLPRAMPHQPNHSALIFVADRPQTPPFPFPLNLDSTMTNTTDSSTKDTVDPLAFLPALVQCRCYNEAQDVVSGTAFALSSMLTINPQNMGLAVTWFGLKWDANYLLCALFQPNAGTAYDLAHFRAQGSPCPVTMSIYQQQTQSSEFANSFDLTWGKDGAAQGQTTATLPALIYDTDPVYQLMLTEKPGIICCQVNSGITAMGNWWNCDDLVATGGYNKVEIPHTPAPSRRGTLFRSVSLR